MKLIFLLFVFSANYYPQNENSLPGWLSGCWEGNFHNGKIITEVWMQPKGNSMLGMSRTIKNDKLIEYEFVRLEKDDRDIIRYIANPSGQKETAFVLVSLEKNKAVFENPEHDFPQRIIYQLITGDSLVARVEGNIRGEIKGSDFPYKKIKCD